MVNTQQASREETWSAVAAEICDAIRFATRGQIRGLAVQSCDESFVVRGRCSAFYLRKEAIEAAKVRIAETVTAGRINSATLHDLIEVIY